MPRKYPRIHVPEKGWARIERVSPSNGGQLYCVGKGWKGWLVPDPNWTIEGALLLAQMFRETQARIDRVQRGIKRLAAEGRTP